jgi:hypothetical protein
MVFLKTLLGFVVSKKGKTHDLKKIEALGNIPVLKIPQEIQVLNGMA